MHVAYLVNQYPKVSHTFVRREILALERQGVQVTRVTVRRVAEVLVDAEDLAEQARTHVLLDAGTAGLLFALCAMALRRPLRFARALSTALRLSVGSERGLLRHLAYLAEACVLVPLLAKQGATHVHAHFGTNSTTVALLCHVLGGPPFSFTVHGPEEFDKPLMLGLPEKIRAARFVVAISSFGRSQLYRYCAFAAWPKIEVVRCGVDAAFLAGEPAAIADTPRLVSVGRLSEQKGQALLVDAAALLAARGVQFELVLVGDGELRPALQARIAEHGLAERVRITGWADGARVRAELLAARAFVLPSFAEGLPVVLMEALALGRPALTTCIAGIPELVTEQCGWLVTPGSVEALAAGMERVLQTPVGELQRLGQAGRARVQALHDVDTEAAKLRVLFERHAAR